MIEYPAKPYEATSRQDFQPRVWYKIIPGIRLYPTKILIIILIIGALGTPTASDGGSRNLTMHLIIAVVFPGGFFQVAFRELIPYLLGVVERCIADNNPLIASVSQLRPPRSPINPPLESTPE